VEQTFELTWDELMELPRQETVCDIHCVTRWSRYDNVFGGIPAQSIIQRAKVKPEARFVLVHAEQGYTTNVPLSDLDRPANLLALTHNGSDLDREHGGPVRLLIPHLYLWKSAKWVTGFEFLEEDYPGFWEQNGYHKRGEPWAEERYGRPDPVRMRRGPRS
jgi:DMSO/TMAO reductase YedYZ molybdopterin-dependent catalytic subunit